jgi:hypothetical protein
MSGERLNGGYAPLYSKKAQELLLSRDYFTALVFWVLGHHADDMGVCRPGVERISRLIGCSTDQVHGSLLCLEKRGYIRVHQTPNIARRAVDIDYQLSPDVIYVREELLERAWLLWKSTGSLSVMSHTQYIPEEQPDSLNQNQNQIFKPAQATSTTTTTKTTTTPEEEKMVRVVAEETSENALVSEGKDKDAEMRRDHQREAPNMDKQEETPARRTTFILPLADPAQEALASEVMKAAPTRLPQARQLVYDFGETSIRRALEQLQREKARGAVKNPFGLVKWWLKSNLVDHDDKNAVPDSSAYTTGKYAEWIKS